MPKKEKPAEKETLPGMLQKLGYDEFKAMFRTKAFYRICPYFCMALKCPFLFICWDIKTKKEVGKE